MFNRKDLKLSVGDYTPLVQKKGINEAFIDDIKEGDIFWCVKLEDHVCIDVKQQEDAEILSRLVRIENILKLKK